VSASPSPSELRRSPGCAARRPWPALWRAAVAGLVGVALAGCAGGPGFAELFDDSAAGEGTGIQGAALVRAVVILARHQATAEQRAVAEKRAQQAIAALERQLAAERSPTAAREKPAVRKPAPTARRSGAPAPPAPTKPMKKLPARIAVRTVKDARTAPGAVAAVMIYDVQARRIVGNEVYDIEDEPRPDETVKFDTSVVRYVGATY